MATRENVCSGEHKMRILFATCFHMIDEKVAVGDVDKASSAESKPAGAWGFFFSFLCSFGNIWECENKP